MAVEIQVQGLAEVMKSLRDFTPDLQRKALDGAAKAGANLFRDEAKRRAPVQDVDVLDIRRRAPEHKPGSLRNGIHTLKKRKLPAGVALGYQVATGKDTFWADYLEFGFHHVQSGKQVMVPFMRPAFEIKKQAVVDGFVASVAQAINTMRDGKLI
jgi:HK97 gp10 family phage protein